MKLPLIASAFFLLLAACQTPEPGVQVIEVEVPVPQPCLPADQIPEEPAMISNMLTGIATDDLPIVAASALRLRAWGRELHAAHAACAGGAE